MHGLGKPKSLIGNVGMMCCMAHRYCMYGKSLINPPGGGMINFRACKDQLEWVRACYTWRGNDKLQGMQGSAFLQHQQSYPGGHHKLQSMQGAETYMLFLRNLEDGLNFRVCKDNSRKSTWYQTWRTTINFRVCKDVLCLQYHHQTRFE